MSSGVRVFLVPLPWLIPLLDAAPAWTRRLLTPVVSRTSLIAELDPWPISAMAMIDATPMMIPRVVRTDRRTFRRSDRSAVVVARTRNRTASRSDTGVAVDVGRRHRLEARVASSSSAPGGANSAGRR